MHKPKNHTCNNNGNEYILNACSSLLHNCKHYEGAEGHFLEQSNGEGLQAEQKQVNGGRMNLCVSGEQADPRESAADPPESASGYC